MDHLPTPDLDTLIADLQRLRAERGNLPVFVQAGTPSMPWLQPAEVWNVNVGLAKGPLKLVSRGGRPIVLLTSSS